MEVRWGYRQVKETADPYAELQYWIDRRKRFKREETWERLVSHMFRRLGYRIAAYEMDPHCLGKPSSLCDPTEDTPIPRLKPVTIPCGDPVAHPLRLVDMAEAVQAPEWLGGEKRHDPYWWSQGIVKAFVAGDKGVTVVIVTGRHVFGGMDRSTPEERN